MDYDRITSNLVAVGKTPESWESPDGTRVLILPYGGRVLGLFTSADPVNFFWTNPDLADLKSTYRLFQGEQWQNPGGDRTWLAPEVDFFLPDYPNCERYCVPAELDPGQYTITKINGTITLINQAILTLTRRQLPIQLTISKSVGPALNPLRHESRGLSGLKYAGYTLNSKLELANAKDERIVVGLWNLLQMPHGGDMLVPTHVRRDPQIYLGDIAQEDLIVTDRLVRYKMRAPGEQKLGIDAIATKGRAGYMYSVGNETALVIRNFSVNPSGEYVDAPWRTPDQPGSAFQACNVNNASGAFSELEYHVPAIGPRLKRYVCEDESQVWAFRGSASEIVSAARCLLAPDI
jgi:hypothetical protein